MNKQWKQVSSTTSWQHKVKSKRIHNGSKGRQGIFMYFLNVFFTHQLPSSATREAPHKVLLGLDWRRVFHPSTSSWPWSLSRCFSFTGFLQTQCVFSLCFGYAKGFKRFGKPHNILLHGTLRQPACGNGPLATRFASPASEVCQVVTSWCALRMLPWHREGAKNGIHSAILQGEKNQETKTKTKETVFLFLPMNQANSQ